MFSKVNLESKFALINGFWSPHIVAELNGQYVKLAKFFKGDFVWHSHEHEDECFQVYKGVNYRWSLEMAYRPSVKEK